jgi:membrane protein YdbS with pleckstrin-like domain
MIRPSVIQTPFSGDGGAVVADETHPPIVQAMLGDGEMVLGVFRPSLWFVLLWPLGSLLFIVGLVFALAWATRFSWANWSESQAFGLGLVFIGVRLGWQFLDWANRLYVLTDRRVIRRRGVFQVDIFEARLSRIQQTAVLQLVRERLFGLGSVAFATAGTATLDALWEAVRDPLGVQRTVTDAIERYGKGPGL